MEEEGSYLPMNLSAILGYEITKSNEIMMGGAREEEEKGGKRRSRQLAEEPKKVPMKSLKP